MKRIRVGILSFWTIWFAVVACTNFFDALKLGGMLPSSWVFASGNFGSIIGVTGSFGMPRSVAWLLFVAVIVWQATAAVAFFRAAWQAHRGAEVADRAIAVAFGTSLSLWAAFLIMDELFISYTFATTHWLLFIATLGSFICIRRDV